MSRGVTLVALGGEVIAALLVTRFLSVVLYRVDPTDPAVFDVVSAVIILTALTTCFVPARRALRLDPVLVLLRLA